MKVEWERVLNLTLWILQSFLALVFLFFGATKFSPHVNYWIELYAKIGIGQWFRYFTGVVEVIGAVLLLVPKTSALAAGLLACTMAGAILIHLAILKDGYAAGFPAFPFLILMVVAWKRGFAPAQ